MANVAGGSWDALSAGTAVQYSLVFARAACNDSYKQFRAERHHVIEARPMEASDAVGRHLYWVWHNIGVTLAEGELIESAMQYWRQRN